ncbi:hypothetical protein [Rhizobium sp. BR 249]|uniref:hypothetical protein n=1 Tax=Rhizobium sp. BR 249 TaxID=3040011 RepID=UPI0039BF3E19
MATAYHMVHYRKVVSCGADKLEATFEAACRGSLGETDANNISLWNRVFDRVFSDPEGMQQQIILNRVADLTSAVFGEMCMVDTKSMQALLAHNPSTVSLSQVTVAEIYDLHESEAPSGSQFVRGMAYWLAIGNHLFFVKTNSMSQRLMQKYFNWLLIGKNAGYPAGAEIDFQAEFNKAAVPSNIGDIKAFRVKGGSAPQFVANVVEDQMKEVSTTKKIADRFVAFSQAVPIIRAILGEEKTKSLVDSLGPQEYLSVDASVKVRGRRTEASKMKLKELTAGLDDLTDGTIQIEGRNGRISDGDAILRTTMPFALVTEGASLLEFNNVADQLQVVYSRFVQDGMIEA